MSGAIGDDHRRRVLLAPRPRSRGRLLPPLAPLQGQIRRPARPQGHPPLRSRELVARLARRRRSPPPANASFTRPRWPKRWGSATTARAAMAARRSSAATTGSTSRLMTHCASSTSNRRTFDGYLRDGCVFADDITIEDTMQVEAQYANGVSMNYTLVAYSPWEGFEVRFHGTEGRAVPPACRGSRRLRRRPREHAHDEGFTTILHRHGERPAAGRGLARRRRSRRRRPGDARLPVRSCRHGARPLWAQLQPRRPARGRS